MFFAHPSTEEELLIVLHLTILMDINIITTFLCCDHLKSKIKFQRGINIIVRVMFISCYFL